MSVREERRSAAREGILAAAHRLLTEGGETSMHAVAARAGVATGTLYRHFPSRGELLAAVVGDALRGEHALLARAADGLPPAEALAAWVRTTTERAPSLRAALLAEPAEEAVAAVRRREVAAQEATLAALLARGAAAGAWPADDMSAQAAAITGALHGTLGRADPALLTRFVLGAVGARTKGA